MTHSLHAILAKHSSSSNLYVRLLSLCCLLGSTLSTIQLPSLETNRISAFWYVVRIRWSTFQPAQREIHSWNGPAKVCSGIGSESYRCGTQLHVTAQAMPRRSSASFPGVSCHFGRFSFLFHSIFLKVRRHPKSPCLDDFSSDHHFANTSTPTTYIQRQPSIKMFLAWMLRPLDICPLLYEYQDHG